MHKSALTTKKVSMSAGTTTAKTAASSDELALAGKGFSAQVEKEYQAKNKNLNFAAVDRMEKIKISPTDMQKFLDAGYVKPTEGGVQ
jgi:glutamate-1-semialdehyde aminotransferase